MEKARSDHSIVVTQAAANKRCEGIMLTNCNVRIFFEKIQASKVDRGIPLQTFHTGSPNMEERSRFDADK